MRVMRPPTGLPVQLTTFVGRASELRELAALTSSARLVTLVGVGGAGKTRLAIEHLAAAAGSVDAAFVDLAAIDDPAQLIPAVAHALAVRDAGDVAAVEDVVAAVGQRRLGLVLDNCEHMLDDVAVLTDALLRRCPAATVIATSREPLRVAGEVTYHIGPLDIDDAMRLFCDRAALARPGVDLLAERAAEVETICRRLDGIPLALELVAARARALSIDELVREVNGSPRIGLGDRLASLRQQTIEASIDWSHELLSPSERAVFRRLSVFAATFDVAAAAAVTARGRVAHNDVVELVASLVDKSLVTRVDGGDRTRYRMLETIRHYAADKLDAAGESDEVRRRLADHFRDRVLHLGSDVADLEAILAAEHENLRVAFEWSVEHGDATTALAIPTALGDAWLRLGWLAEGQRWLQTALQLEDDVDPALRARALGLAAKWGGNYGENPWALEHGDEALRIARELDDPDALKAALTGAARARYQVEPYEAIPYDTELLEVARRDGDVANAALATAGIGLALLLGGDAASALPFVEEADLLLRHTPNVADWTQARGVLAAVLGGVGRLSDAREVVASTLPQTTEGEPGRWLLQYVGARSAAYTGDVAEADRWAAELTASGDRTGVLQPRLLGRYAAGLAAMAAGDVRRARAELEAAVATSETWGPVAAGSPLDLEVAKHTPNPYAAEIISPLAEVTLLCGDREVAQRWVEVALEFARSYPSHRAVARMAEARILHAAGDTRAAIAAALEALELKHGLGDGFGVANALELVAVLTMESTGAESGAESSIRLLAAAARIRDEIGARRLPIFDERVDAVRARLEARLGGVEAERAWARGAAMTTDDVVALARRRRTARAKSGWDSLTLAELEVVRLIGDGLSNKEIAARLHLSARTVQSHLSHVYRKLGLRSRLELAREYRSRGGGSDH